MDKFTQLVNDLDEGKLTTTHIQSALREYYRNRKDIPEEMKSVVCGTSRDAGLIFRSMALLWDTIGKIELVYLRALNK